MVNRALKIFCLSVLVLLAGIPSLAQNTKGDKPAPTPRETRFKTPKKSKPIRRSSGKFRQSDRAGNRISVPPSRSRGGERAGRPIRPSYSQSAPSDKQKPWRGDITKRRIRPRASSGRASNVYPQPPTTNYSSRELRRSPRNNVNPNVKRVRRMQQHEQRGARVGRPIRPTFHKSTPRHKERPWRGDITGRRIRTAPSDGINNPPVRNYPRVAGGNRGKVQRGGLVPPRVSGRAKNVFSGRSYWVNNQSRRRPPRMQGTNRSALNMLPGPGQQKPRFRSGKISPRSASAAYMARRSTNTWAHFPRPKRRQERAYTTDLAGKKLRTKNFETQRPILTNPTLKYQKRIAAGERAYKGPSGGYVSRTKSGQRAWKGDVAGYRIRGGKPPGGEKAFLGFLKGKPARGAGGIGYQGNMRAGRRGFRDQGEQYSGNIRTGRRGFRDQGEQYSGNIRTGRRGFRDQGEEYSGNIKTGRRGFRDQGEEYSGNIRTGRRGFRDQGEEYSGNIRTGRRGFRDQGEEYTGNIRTGKRGFRDQGEEYTGNIRTGKRGFRDQGEEYTGNIRTGKRGFRDQGEEYTGNLKRGRRGFSDQGEEYTGNIKGGGRPFKGGGSRSGKLWNNNNTPIAVRTPSGKSARIAGYQGNIKGGRKVFNEQGEGYTGNLKARRPDKGGGSVSGKLWNNEEKPLPPRDYSSQLAKVTRYSGNMKARRPEKGGGSVSGKLWNNNERPIYVRTPKNREGGDFSGDVKLARNHYSRNPKSADGALRGVKASASMKKADIYSRGARRDWDYIRNPSSDDQAQRTREPGRAFARSTGFNGNIRVHKFDLFGKKDERHPDARFVKLNKNNVPEEKDMFTNFKLWWARLFKKSETQPDHLKEKPRSPRYDKGEAGLWYE